VTRAGDVAQRRMSARLMPWLKLFMGLGALALLFVFVDWQAALDVLLRARPAPMVVAGCSVLVVWALDALRLHWMTPIDHMPYREHLRLAFQSAFVMQFGFGVFSGDGYRVAGYALKSGKVIKPTAHMVASRVAGFTTVAIMSLLASVWVLLFGDAAFAKLGHTIIYSVLLYGGGAAVVLAMILFVLQRRQKALHAKLEEVVHAFSTLTPRIWALSILMVLVRAIGYACILAAIGVHKPFYVPLLASLVATLSSLIPVMGGLGVREGSYTAVTTIFGVPPALGLGAALLMRFVVLIATSFGLLISLVLKPGTTGVDGRG